MNTEVKEQLKALVLDFFEQEEWEGQETILQEITNLIVRLPYPSEVTNTLSLDAVVSAQEKAMNYIRLLDDFPKNPKPSDEKILHHERYGTYLTLISLREIIDLSADQN